MPTETVKITPYAWVDVVTDLSLVVGETYIAQVVGGAKARLFESATEPAVNAPGFILNNQEDAWSFTVETGLGIYLLGHKNDTLVAVNKVGGA